MSSDRLLKIVYCMLLKIMPVVFFSLMMGKREGMVEISQFRVLLNMNFETRWSRFPCLSHTAYCFNPSEPHFSHL